ncbi:MAG: hypothetical protein LKF84_05990, partial [Prevotella sp.]|nr:hypothetical protein [Prevotella sp.]
LLAQNSSFFTEQIRGLSTYQMNFIRAICKGYHDNFGSREVQDGFPMGSKSNIDKIKKALIDREIIDVAGNRTVLADSVFQHWFTREFMSKVGDIAQYV